MSTILVKRENHLYLIYRMKYLVSWKEDDDEAPTLLMSRWTSIYPDLDIE
jgi:hypothetical protein